ncbi:MAG: hypothetical protein ACTS45_02000, partial [Candidatus Hodgkinia cicadicola]
MFAFQKNDCRSIHFARYAELQNRFSDFRYDSQIELKPILHWLLSHNLASSTLLKTIVRCVTISQLRMTGNATNLSCFTRKLIVNFRRIRALTKLAKSKGFVQNWTETMGFAIPRNA